ncbi:hypothetical protein DFQ14_103116 [Halopolyspora algeriensis]|uniref:Putative T7SS secretion signal domain-containing protein n=1 Tax=Halopolyspora algeriensis TaxID=1500506 RepID=A0A368VT16_9ACTN|nr:hypothetical protein [Halopolyspora algeriensis]RCW45152.1 hypothetical protein DFQ14_103116 [Halopolyspora algeriensis]TQM53128.1 hypothetical protein FHU43_2508 [Halopolyspora algeriensis]
MTGTSEYPALGFDPAPGTVTTVESVATDLQQVATKMGNAHEALAKIGRQDGLWEGKAAEAFLGTVDELPKYLDQAHRSLGGAARTLTQWSGDLSSMQQKARHYEADAAAAQQRVREAESNPALGLANQYFPDQASLQEAQRKLDAAQAALNDAHGDLEAIRRQAQRLLQQHDDLAKDVELALRRAADEAPKKPGLLERLGDALEQLGQSISDAAGQAWQWIQDHADIIAKVGDVLSTVGTVLSVVAAATSWIPGVNAVTACAAVGVSAAAMGTHALAKAAGADVSWSKMAFDAVGMIPGGGAAKGGLAATKILPKAVKSGKTAAKFADSGKAAAGAQAASKTINRAGAQAVGSRANMVNKAINAFGGEGVAVNSWKTGGSSLLGVEKMAHTAQSGAAVATGTGVLTAEKSAIMVAKWEAQPYIEKGENAVKDAVGNAARGFQNALAAR